MRLKFAALLAGAASLSAALATPAMAEVIEEGEAHFVTRDTATVEATPYETWLALIAPSRYWNDAHTWSGDAENMYLSAQGGGCFCELLPEPEDAPDGVRRGSARHMEVVLADPGKALRMRGGLGPLQSEPVNGVLTITLKAVEGGTRILWEYNVAGQMRFEVPLISKAVDGVMSQQLAGLTNLLGALEGAEDEEADEELADDENTSDGENSDDDDSSKTEDVSSSDAVDEESGDDDGGDEDDVRIEPKQVLSLEEAIDQMASEDK